MGWSPDRFRSGAVGAIRFFLAVVFITYGVVKLMGGQYYYGDWAMTKGTVEGPFLVWSFYGYSPYYGRATGLFELIPGLLLLFGRTATLAAGALFAVSLNITLMDFAFGFPSVKYSAALYTLLCGVLMLHDANKWRLMLLTRTEADHLAAVVARDPPAFREPTTRLSRAAWGWLIVLGLPLVLFALHLLGTAIAPGPEGPAMDAAVRLGYRKEDLDFRRSRYTGLSGIGRTARIEITVKNVTPPRTITVEATKANGFTGWKVGAVSVDSTGGTVR